MLLPRKDNFKTQGGISRNLPLTSSARGFSSDIKYGWVIALDIPYLGVFTGNMLESYLRCFFIISKAQKFLQ